VYVNRGDEESGTGGWEVHAFSKMLAVGHRASVISVTVGTVCCSVLHCVLQCVAMCCSVLQRVLQCVAVCCGMLQRVCCYQIVFVILATFGGVCCSVLQRVLQCVVQCVAVCVAVCYGVLRCVTVCCSVCVAGSWSSRFCYLARIPQHSATEICNTMQHTLQHTTTLPCFYYLIKCWQCCSVLQRFAVCCRVLQCVAACLSSQYLPAALQCVAACCSVLQRVASCV